MTSNEAQQAVNVARGRVAEAEAALHKLAAEQQNAAEEVTKLEERRQNDPAFVVADLWALDSAQEHAHQLSEQRDAVRDVLENLVKHQAKADAALVTARQQEARPAMAKAMAAAERAYEAAAKAHAEALAARAAAGDAISGEKACPPTYEAIRQRYGLTAAWSPKSDY